ncbi:NAD(P)H-quinone oxidoreductase [Marisediminicola sp. LYQ85]|uniref:NAD(P)H-quinone oxidoreductase n=1 Tax=Marisediminicola sp. LYQ85 TaxID=3391062 RepID=UPI003983073C
MRAVVITQPGGADVLQLADIPTPPVGDTDVSIAVVAAGINGADLAQRRGVYPPPPGAPDWPGLEVSGTVSAVGGSVTGFAVGDEVCALVSGGGYAESVVVDERLVLPVPRGVTVESAAALPEVAATVWSNLVMNAGLAHGDTLLVHGGSSGIGTMAIQVGVALGCRVIATAGSAEKVAVVESLGAAGIRYRDEDFVEAVARLTDGAGVDVVLDMVGGDYIARDIRCLAIGGRIMVIANQSGDESTLDVGALMRVRGRVWATTLRSRPIGERAQIVAAVAEKLWPLIESGRVQPIIDSVFALAEASAAHERMESSAHIGKILLSVGPPVEQPVEPPAGAPVSPGR